MPHTRLKAPWGARAYVLKRSRERGGGALSSAAREPGIISSSQARASFSPAGPGGGGAALEFSLIGLFASVARPPSSPAAEEAIACGCRYRFSPGGGRNFHDNGLRERSVYRLGLYRWRRWWWFGESSGGRRRRVLLFDIGGEFDKLILSAGKKGRKEFANFMGSRLYCGWAFYWTKALLQLDYFY